MSKHITHHCKDITQAVLSKLQHITKNFIMMKICDAYSTFQRLLVGKATRRISCTEGARSETACMNGGSKRRKQKSFNKIHSVLVRTYLSTHSATNHTKQNTPVKLLSSGCRRWDEREEDTQLPPHTGELIMIKLLANDLKSDKYPQICSSLCEVPPMYSKFRVQIVEILCLACYYAWK